MNAFAELIDVTQIRISQAHAHVAVLGEFRAADRLLWTWAECAPEYVEIDFEISFQDGYTYAGRYGFRRRSRSRPSLSKFVRRAFTGQGPSCGSLPPCPERYLIEGF